MNAKLGEFYDEEKVEAAFYKQIMGSLRYLCDSIPDICYTISIINKFVNEHRKSHLVVAKRILNYLRKS